MEYCNLHKNRENPRKLSPFHWIDTLVFYNLHAQAVVKSNSFLLNGFLKVRRRKHKM